MVTTGFSQWYTVKIEKSPGMNNSYRGKREWGNRWGLGDEEGPKRFKEMKNYKKRDGRHLSLWNLSRFANWHLLKLGFYLPTEAWRQRPYLQMLTGTNSKLFWKSWFFSSRYFKGWGLQSSYGCGLELLKTILAFCSSVYKPKLRHSQEKA